MKNKFLDSITIFTTGMSAADYLWKAVTIIIIASGGTVTGVFASETPFFQELGVVSWVAVGLICSVTISLIFYLIKLAQNQSATAEYTRAVSQPKSRVNPLLESFKDQIIPIEELRIPGKQLHENKHFKRCSFVGPGAIFLAGGTFANTSFINIGDIIPIPKNTLLTGIVGLNNCTVEDCEFHKITVIVDETQARIMVANIPGLKLAGE